MNKQPIQLEWILPESEKVDLVEAIELDGGSVEDSGRVYQPTAEEAPDYAAAGFEPLTIITATAAAVFVIQALAKIWRDRNVSGGTIVNARGGRLVVRRVPAMETGRMVIVTESGTRIVDRKDQNEGKALLTDLVSNLAGNNG
jgi:hypothetical protein